MKTISFIFLVLGVFWNTQVFAADSAFEAGKKAVNAKNYQLGISQFEKAIAHQKENTSAHFNLGVCHFKLQNYGKAILHFERVLHYSPSDEDAALWIQICYDKLGYTYGWYPHITGLEKFIVYVGANNWAYLALIFSVFSSFSLFYVIQKKNARQNKIVLSSLAVGLLLLIASIVVANRAVQLTNQHVYAIVTQKNVRLKNQKIQLLPEGTKIKIISSDSVNYVLRTNGGPTVEVPKGIVEII